jgi:hypothetical protein
MILRRVIQHVRKQEWTAIGIDLVIVVVGVYIGIQAQAWNAAREDRGIERQYLWSLHDQLVGLIESNVDRVVAGRDRLDALREVAENFELTGEKTELDVRHCRAIAASHIYVAQIVVPSTIEELISTGRLQLIRKSEMRLSIVSYAQTIEGYRQLNTDIQTDRAVLSRLYPSMIVLRLHDDDAVTCDFEAMSRSSAFRNDLADNSFRHDAYVENVVIGQQDLRKRLHALLDDELGFADHEGALEQE